MQQASYSKFSISNGRTSKNQLAGVTLKFTGLALMKQNDLSFSEKTWICQTLIDKNSIMTKYWFRVVAQQKKNKINGPLQNGQTLYFAAQAFANKACLYLSVRLQPLPTGLWFFHHKQTAPDISGFWVSSPEGFVPAPCTDVWKNLDRGLTKKINP